MIVIIYWLSFINLLTKVLWNTLKMSRISNNCLFNCSWNQRKSSLHVNCRLPNTCSSFCSHCTFFVCLFQPDCYSASVANPIGELLPCMLIFNTQSLTNNATKKQHATNLHFGFYKLFCSLSTNLSFGSNMSIFSLALFLYTYIYIYIYIFIWIYM